MGAVRSRSISLIGFMGTGKTSVGRAFASHTGRQFLDTDSIVEEKLGKSISQVFSEDGEKFFH